MNLTRRVGLASQLVLLAATAAVARGPAVECTATAAVARGPAVECTVNGVGVQATAVSDTVFRLSVNAKGPAGPMDSIYLDPARAPETGGAVGGGDVKSIKTAAGELRLDTKAGRYTLLDAAGKTVVPWAAVVPAKTAADAVSVGLGWPKGRPFAVYASGNPNGKLVQSEVKARLGNGVAVQPFFWTPAGFAVLVVGGDANRPMSCDGKVDGDAVTLVSPGTAADVYLMLAPTLGDATRGLHAVTGRAPVPPLWAFGYLQCRWNWTDAAYIDDVIRNFTTRNLPVDALIFDFEWYTAFPDYFMPPEGNDGFPDFKIHTKLFPDQDKPFKKVADAGLKFVGIRKPRLGDKNSLAMIREKGWDVVPPNTGLIEKRSMDFANPAMREWYARQTEPLLRAGAEGWWNDEGEFTYTTYTYWVMAQQEAHDKVKPHERLWTINRAFCPGTARGGSAAWTGDIEAKWPDLRRATGDLLNWSVSGMPYGSTDIGGFAGETNAELLTRWMQVGTFSPNMRAHSTADARPHFPWLWGEAAEAAMKKALDLRYRLVPLWYGLAHEAAATGTPPMRPLVMAYPDDPEAAEISDQWLVGDGLMAAPVIDPGGQRSVYLPAGEWYDFATGRPVAGGRRFDVACALDETPVYVRAGTVLPLATAAVRTADLSRGPLEVRVYAGRDAAFTVAEDDGHSDAYARGAARKTTFAWNDRAGELSWTRTGDYDGPAFSTFRVTVIGPTPWQTADRPLTPAGRVTAATK